jgi:UDP-glucose 4-epimerase
MRVTVTGGAGFIGSHLVERLQAEEASLQVVDDLSTGLRHQVPEGADFVHACITSDEARQAVTAFAPNVLVHLAAQVDVRVSLEQPAYDARINVSGMVSMVEAARRGGGLEKVVLASSAAVYGEQGAGSAAESHPITPINAYGAAKRSCEIYLAQYQRTHNLPYVALRFANVYGPRQSPEGEAGVVAIFARRLAAGEPLCVYGDGTATRDYLYVSDVVEGLWQAAVRPSVRGELNLGTGVETSVNELCEQLFGVAGTSVEVDHVPGRLGEVARSLLDASQAQADLGWVPRISMHSGLSRVWRAASTGVPA